LPLLDGLHFGQPPQGLLQTRLALLCCAPLRRLAAPAAGGTVALHLVFQLRHPRPRLLQRPFELVLPTKRAGPGAGPHPDAVVRDLLELDRPGGHQAGHADAEQLIQRLAMLDPKVRQAVVVDLHAPAQPAVGVVTVGHPRELPGAAHTLQRGVQPQRQQDLGGNGGSPDPALDGLDAGVHRRQVLPLDPGPHEPRPVARLQQRFQVAGAHLDLPPLGPQHTGGGHRRRGRRHRNGRRRRATGQVLALEQVVGALSHGRLMLQNITHALSPTHTDVASAMTEIFTGSERGRRRPRRWRRATPGSRL
jgi:hypothetical protein